MSRQFIPSHIATAIISRPGTSAYHEFGRTAWLEVRDDGGLTVSAPLPGLDWKLYMNSGAVLVTTSRATMTEIRWVGPPMDFGSGVVASVDAELTELRHMGVSIGLTLADVEDTVRVWTDWCGVGPATHRDFGIISRSLARRGQGQPWRPDDHQEDEQ